MKAFHLILSRGIIPGAFAGAVIAGQVLASSHREAPNISRFPTLDSTDFFVFNSYQAGREDYVTLIANYIPLQDAYGGPNYFAMDPDAVYNIHIDNDGDAIEDITFAFTFSNALPAGPSAKGQGLALTIGDKDHQKTVAVPLKNIGAISFGDQSAANFIESYQLSIRYGETGKPTTLTNPVNSQDFFYKPLDYIGFKTFGGAGGYQAYAEQFIYPLDIPGCDAAAQVFAGQRKDPFVVNLGKIFDLVNFVPVEGDSTPGTGDGGGFPGGISQSADNDDLIDKNVTSLAIEVPKACLTGDGNGTIGAWTSASLPQVRILNPRATFARPDISGGAKIQVSRLGAPLVNELVIGLKDKDRFSSAMPKNDGQFLDYVTHPSLAELLNILFKDTVNQTLGADITSLAPTNFPRNDLVTAFLTGFSGVNQLAEITPSEMLRLNTQITATAASEQSPLGVIDGDLSGFPNGRRPGDDVVDIALRVIMGRLCYPLEINGTAIDLGLCKPADASVGLVPFTDGAPGHAGMMTTRFPYLAEPVPGSR
ncbi:DUF4331 domain-containing protein [Thalassomonas haliotis]|uniref:DUF4331 domain-containing protein n=1 Tax=Thalassomonas haliotis TaxID=485448 RepID=A0ABY7VL75_9GAMM|nr:DUF4331 domain-containing protein [Thalassomonas haliotis]WDE14280.1 DUF4331 domain-containing protein [Thalassomonas haliotis]